jgi:signal transduction histidine kinase
VTTLNDVYSSMFIYTLFRYIGHEIRTPLNIVSIGLDLLKTDLRKEKAKPETIESVIELKGSCNVAVDILNVSIE